MTTAIVPQVPGGGGMSPGFGAVFAKYGERMVQRIKNWPILAEHYALAADEDEGIVKAEVDQAKRNVQKAAGDSVYALEQAATIARVLPRDEWDVVLSVAQIRREWGYDAIGDPIDCGCQSCKWGKDVAEVSA